MPEPRAFSANTSNFLVNVNASDDAAAILPYSTRDSFPRPGNHPEGVPNFLRAFRADPEGRKRTGGTIIQIESGVKLKSTKILTETQPAPHPSQSRITGLRSVPRPSISTSTTSPFFNHTGGLRAMPTPGGVPVKIRSPGSSVKIRDR